ncbi:MAG: cardiolipin synthase [Oscillospiraceae bacterium]|nr:cardiolipin synthase [Oscillospiraceae bacterium]
MKNKISVETDPRGLRLLKQGRRGLWRAAFSRAGFITLFLLLQLGLLLAGVRSLQNFIPHYYTFSLIFTGAMGLFLVNSRREPNAKLTWLLVILLLPVFGGLLYLYTKSNLGHRILQRRFAAISRETRDSLPQPVDTLVRLEDEAPEMKGLARYVNRSGCFPVWDETAVRYFPLGDALFPALLEELEKAERFIYLEFFIIAEGEMWGRILEILARKAAAGVEVRLLYDGTNEFFTLPRDYSQRLAKLGIQAKAFAPVMPFVSTHYNYRDHRKILVIDGRVAVNGGINLADEYINRVRRFGHWKDCAVMLKGPAVRSFTLMFLQMWDLEEGKLLEPERLSAPVERESGAGGFVLPYADCPLDRERVGEWVYLDILNRARRYVHIMSPYLILDEEMETALKFAAGRGVDVRLILPGIPDKRLPYALAKTYYRSLLESGVRIYEYSPGFVHAKVFVSDDREATVGTVNLDYRSLYHHFECGTYLRQTDCVREIEADFLATQEQCRTVTTESLRKLPLRVKLEGVLMKALAPLL